MVKESFLIIFIVLLVITVLHIGLMAQHKLIPLSSPASKLLQIAVIIAFFVTIYCFGLEVGKTAFSAEGKPAVAQPLFKTRPAGFYKFDYYPGYKKWFVIHATEEKAGNLRTIFEKSNVLDAPDASIPCVGMQINYFTDNGILLKRELIVEPAEPGEMVAINTDVPAGTTRIIYSPPSTKFHDLIAYSKKL